MLPGPLLSITHNELVEIGQGSDHKTAVQMPMAQGGGYIASLEAYHQLHVRQLNQTDDISDNDWSFDVFISAL